VLMIKSDEYSSEFLQSCFSFKESSSFHAEDVEAVMGCSDPLIICSECEYFYSLMDVLPWNLS